MLKTNASKLVRIAVEGKVAPALVWPNEVGHDGTVHNLPGIGGITYNVLIGDAAFDWEADHIEPGVSTILNAEKRSDRPNVAYNFLACIGNEAIVLTGKAKGAKGTVVGHHGGAEHLLLDFAPRVLEKLSVDDRFQLRTFGQGLRLLDHPAVTARSIDPALLSRLKIREKGKSLEIPVAAIVPAELMGSGLGSNNCHTGDYDIMTSDAAAVKRHGLAGLKLGDLVAIEDHDASFGWRYLKGAVVIGVIIHGDSKLSGHGPGVCTILSSATGAIHPKFSKDANIGRALRLGRYRNR